ncbi:MAG: hypothetical protein JWQ44_2870 [Chthoniobacter sp.]|nr:hypothetical protein [Chthoniobacter sp.]
MTDLMKQLRAGKVERRRQLAALPVGEKLRMLEEMVADTRGISATQPPKPLNPVRVRGKKGKRPPVVLGPPRSQVQLGNVGLAEAELRTGERSQVQLGNEERTRSER